MTGGFRWRASAWCVAAGLVLTLTACTSTSQAAGPDGVGPAGVGSTGDAGMSSSPVTVSPLTPGVDAVSPNGGPSEGDAVDGDTPGSDAVPGSSTSAAPEPDAASVTATPAFGTTELAPAAAITLKANGGRLAWVTMTNPEGDRVDGTLSEDGSEWSLAEPLGFGKTYTVTGIAVNAIGVQTRIDGDYTTATTRQPITTVISPGDGDVVGVAMPVTVRFGIAPENKALIEKNVSITTDPPVEGAWAWVQHTDQGYPALDWRPKEFWPAGTKVHVESNIYGLKFQDGWYGGDDVSVDFTIGRNQVVKANADTQKVEVFRDGALVETYYGSFGMGDDPNSRYGLDPNLVTRSGIHVVTVKKAKYKMSNPDYGYEDVQEYWAVRISNNGEFIHNNPGTSQWALHNANITHGCINLGWDNAKEYFKSAMRGDPVIISGTSVQLSRSDGDIYDWTIPWDTWLTMSALAEDSIVE